MTYREYLNEIDDEFLRVRIIAEIARQYPNYEQLHRYEQRELCKKILDSEVVEVH